MSSTFRKCPRRKFHRSVSPRLPTGELFNFLENSHFVFLFLFFLDVKRLGGKNSCEALRGIGNGISKHRFRKHYFFLGETAVLLLLRWASGSGFSDVHGSSMQRRSRRAVQKRSISSCKLSRERNGFGRTRRSVSIGYRRIRTVTMKWKLRNLEDPNDYRI